MIIPQKYIDRFWARVDKSGDCWIWTGSTNSHGYGTIRIEKVYWHTHRLVATLIHGPLPSNVFVCHHCDNPPCCNPAHLFLGSNLDNMRDMTSKRRTHLLSPEQEYEIAARYQAGDQFKAICVAYDISTATFWRVIHRTGTPVQHRVARNFAYSPELADEIRTVYAAGGVTQLALAERYCLATGTISCIIRRFHGR